LFLDEPQKMEGGKTLDSLANFKPLAVLRYSATHKTAHNKIHRLDPDGHPNSPGYGHFKLPHLN
jgi:restriction endonuclease